MTVAFTWQWRPNWAAGVTERLEWRTDVQVGYAAAETRFALRNIPRRTWSWEMLIADSERQRFEAQVWSRPHLPWLVPLWWDVSRENFAVGSTSYDGPSPETSREIDTGSYFVFSDAEGSIGKGPVTRSIAIVGGLAVNRYTWPGALSRSFTNAYLHSARLARVTVEQVGQVTSGVATYRCTAEATEDIAPPITNPVGAFGGLGAYTIRPDRGEIQDATWELIRERVDYGGRVFIDPQRTAPITVRTHRHICPSRASARTLRGVAQYLRGRFRSVVVPTWNADLTPLSGIVSAGTTIDIAPINWTGYLASAGGRNRIVVVTRAGQYVWATISSAYITGDTETLVMSAAWGANVALGDIRQICWADLSRMESDALEIAWMTPEVAEIAIPWRMLA
jgi:hypothetical protein